MELWHGSAAPKGGAMSYFCQRRQFLSWSAALAAGGLLPHGAANAIKTAETQATLVLELDLSTRTRDAGRAIEAGVRAALQSSKSALPVLLIDSHGNPARALDALREHSSQGAIIAIIGGGDANVTPVVARWAKMHQVPYGMVWAGNGPLQADDRWCSAFGLSDERAIAALIRQAQAYKTNRWGFLLSNDALGRASYDALLSLMTAANSFELVGVQWHDVSANEIGAQYLRLQQQGAQAVWLTGQPRASRLLAEAMQLQSKQKKGIPVVASSNAWNAEFAALAKPSFADLPFYFALPKPSGATSWKHPARWQAEALTLSLLSEIKKVPVDLDKQRLAIAGAWSAIQGRQRNAPIAIAHFGTQQRLDFVSAARVFG
jgi:hypothetical protein